jgi:catechol 2,3-dioxygenase-like lactoylglutathione lyase family enzyme
MIDHASIGGRDLAAAVAFYGKVLAAIGLQKLVEGASDNGVPGARPEYSDAYYAAFIGDAAIASRS